MRINWSLEIQIDVPMPDKEKKRYSVKEKENHIFAFSSNNMTVNRGEYYRQSHNLN